MRKISTLLAALILAGCATTNAERAERVNRDVDEMIEVYGPGCEKLGYQKDSDPWRSCVLQLSLKDSYERYRNYSTTTANCFGYRGFFQCTPF